MVWVLLGVFFFLQAEDGIRDDLVTGVQTCALPIFRVVRSGAPEIGAAAHQQLAAPIAHRILGTGVALTLAAVAWGVVNLDRKSGVEGKRVDLGGRPILKKKKNQRSSGGADCVMRRR